MNNNTEMSAAESEIRAKFNSLTTYQKVVGGCILAAPVLGIIGGVVSIAKEIITIVKK